MIDLDKIAGTFSAAYDKLDSEDYQTLLPEDKLIHSGMSIQLQNLIQSMGKALEVEDMGQWYYDCGMRVCGSKQYTCESCQNGETL
jgi:hypothetical protein